MGGRDVPLVSGAGSHGEPDLLPRKLNAPTYKHFVITYKAFHDQLNRFEGIVHEDVG
jgi:hypothetical protein